jgi:hypothetical protein
MPGQPAPPDPDDDRLTVELEGVGFQPNRILSYRINTQYTTPTDSWEFVVYSEDDPRGLRRRFRPLQPIRLYIAGNLQVIGRIDKIEGTGESGAALKVSGRDYLADLVDSTVDPQFQIKKSQDIGAFLLDLLKPWGITTVFGNSNLTRNALTGRKPFTKNPAKHYNSAKLEDTKASENQGVFEFANRVVARHGFMILPAGTRDSIVVDAPNYEQTALYSVSRPGNILSGTASRDYTDIPTVTIAHGRMGGSSPGEESPSGQSTGAVFTPAAGTPAGKQGQFAANPSNDVQGTGRRPGSTIGGSGSGFAGNPSNDTQGTGRRDGTSRSQFASNPSNDVRGTGRRTDADPGPSAAGPTLGGKASGKDRFGTFDETGASSLGRILEVQRCITSDDGVIVVREKRFDPKKPDHTIYGFDFPVYKPLFYRDKDSRNDEQLNYSVRRVIAEKLRATLTYNCTVRGHVEPKSGATWAVDTLVNVRDEVEDVNEAMWILERTFENDGTSGPVTHLSMVRPGSFVF